MFNMMTWALIDESGRLLSKTDRSYYTCFVCQTERSCINKPIYTEENCSFSPFDRVALAQLIRRSARPGCRMAEIGSWLGDGSTQIFLEELRNCTGASLLCVDTWQGSPNVRRHQELVSKYDVFGTFRKNVEMARSPVRLQVLIGTSVESAPLM